MRQQATREQWVAEAFALLCMGGIAGVRVEPLAKRLGRTKGSFYHHFDDRRDLHLAMLAEWERLGTTMIIDQVDGTSTDPAKRLRLLILRSCEVSEIGDQVETAIRAWATVDDVAAEAARRVDQRRVSYVVDLLVAAGFDRALARRRSRLLYRYIVGEFVWRTSGGPASSKRELDELADLLLTS